MDAHFAQSLYTPVDLPDGLPAIDHTQRLMLMGSCFATEIGRRLQQAKFHCEVNPFGVLYNPLSITAALRQMLDGKVYEASDLFEHGGLWHSPMHHGDFSAPTAEDALRRINSRLQTGRALLLQADRLLLTWGTAYVYEDTATGRVVGNCHKLPESCFNRRRLSVDEIMDHCTALLAPLLERRPSMAVLITVSPIRHIRDGLHANQLSKATLLLAADRLQQAFDGRVAYFPAYELLTDELRDYRFYADDLVHPSERAVHYVWTRFAQACFTAQTRQVVAECERIGHMLAHRPLHPQSEDYKRFLEQIVLKIDQLNRKYPYLEFQNEKELCRTQLNAFAK